MKTARQPLLAPLVARAGQSEFVRCKSSIHAIGFALVLLLVGIICIVVASEDIKNKPCTLIDNTVAPGINDVTCDPDPTIDAQFKSMVSSEILAGSVLILIALLITIIAIACSFRYKCFYTALSGTLLGLLILV